MSLDVSELIGVTIRQIENKDNEELIFTTTYGDKYRMYHEQDCCEDVYIEDIIGDLEDLIGEPILMAEEVSEQGDVGDSEGSTYTWTFYKFGTRKGYVTIRWYGTSNGYYSESVNFMKMGA